MSHHEPLPVGTKIVAGTFLLSGVTHLVRPVVFESLIPARLGRPRPWVYASGGAELVCAAGLLTRQPWAPATTAATLSVIWVGNWTMAIRWQRSSRRTRAQKAGAWARLPLQVPLISWAWTSPVRSGRTAPAASPDRTDLIGTD